MKTKAKWVSVKTNWTTGKSEGIVGEGSFDVQINRHLKETVRKQAEQFLRKFDSDAEITELTDGAFEMRSKESGNDMGYVFRVLEYDVKEEQTLLPDEIREIGKAIWFQ